MAVVYLVTMFAALASVNSKVAIDPLSASVLADQPSKKVFVEVGSYPRPKYGYVEQDEEEAKCIPTKDYADTNVYAGMTGYDLYIGNPTDALVDPGVKSRIFLHDCDFGYYDFISDVGGDLNCESDFSTKLITSMDQYEQERTSTNRFAISASVSASASYMGVKGSVSAAYSRATNADEQTAVKVLSKYKGEIVQAKATCITMSVSIADNVRPLFTKDFINHLKDMHEAIKLDAGDDKKTRVEMIWKAFVTEFGTHFMRTTKLGSQIIYQRRLESRATTTSEMKKRSECVSDEANASLKGSGYGIKAEASVAGGREDCGEMKDGSDFALKEGFAGVKILSKGSRPADLHSWADNDNKFDPVPVERFLAPMTELFKDKWMTKSTFYGFDKSLNGAGIGEMFLTKMKSYCSLMLDGVLDINCNYEVCTKNEWKDKCKNGGTCMLDERGLPKCECTDGFIGDTCEPPKIDCQWGAYGAWSPCSVSCGGGTKKRTRQEATPASNVGAPCTGSATKIENCNSVACPGNNYVFSSGCEDGNACSSGKYCREQRDQLLCSPCSFDECLQHAKDRSVFAFSYRGTSTTWCKYCSEAQFRNQATYKDWGIYVRDYQKIRSDSECKSSDQLIGTFLTLSKCSTACRQITGCKYFVYGKGSSLQAKCYWEKTASDKCPEGWEDVENYDFYKTGSTA